MLLAAARRLSGGQAGASGSSGGSLGQHRAAGPLLVRGPVRGGPASGTASPAGHAIWRTAPLTWHAGLATAAGRPGAAAASHAAATAAADTASPSSPPLGPAAAAGIDPATFVVVNFYHLVDVAAPGKLHADHAAALSALDIAGRIYITPQGINAQFSGPAGDADAYVAWVRSTPGFAGITPSAEVAPGGGHLFPRLRLKLKPDLISLAGGCGRLPLTDPTVRAKPLKPDEWAAMLGLGGAGASGSTSASTSPPPSTPAPIVLDVRNGYEWDAGHFAGAARPLEDQFNETPTDVAPRVPVVLAGDDSEGDEGEGLSSSDPLPIPAHLANAPRDAPVMMYCTGGIRCDVYSAHLSAQGFTNLYTLEGGVHAYFREQGGAAPGWDGSLFVFDARMAVSPDGRTSSDAAVASGEAPLPAATPCALCGSPDAALPHLNCANIDCNRLFIACRACAARHTGCCCEACMAAPRLLRPAKVSGQYGTWASTVDAEDAETLAAAMAAGRGDGRRDRRRARAARLAASRGEHRVERARRKALMRAALAEREAQGGGQKEEDAEQASERLARLADLRARLGRGAGAAAAGSSQLVAEFTGATCPACGASTAATRVATFAGGGSAGGPLLVAAAACAGCGWRGAADAWDSDGPPPPAPPSSPVRLVIASPEDAAAPLPRLPAGAGLSIPELGLEWAAGSARAARAATPAALLAGVRADLGGRRVVGVGEGSDGGADAEWAFFWQRFEEVEAGRAPWTLVVGGDEEGD